MNRTAGPRRVPVIALTGHLGAGKTSLLNHLLRRPGARLGVIVNDFGALNVDAALISGQVNQAAAISGGCLCCLPDAGGLDDALESLARPLLKLDAILVEASGIAEPVALDRLIRFSGAEHIRSGGMVEVIDAVDYFDTLDTGELPPARLRAPSLVIIGKTDLLPPEERESRIRRIIDRIHSVNPRVECIVAERGGVDPDLIFDSAEHEDPPDQLPIAQLIREQSPDHAEHGHVHSASLELPGTTAPDALVELLERPPQGAYRLKGRVRILTERGMAGYRIDVVGRFIDVVRLPAPPNPGEVVVIGADLDEQGAQARLHNVAAAPNTEHDEVGLRRLLRYQRS
jgi:G3E family GTPase